MEAKYDTIGREYNVTRQADPYLTENLIRLLSPSPDSLYLDIGCGTGSYTVELQKRGYNLIGIDPSIIMLEEARTRNSAITWLQGYAERTTLPKNHIHGILGSLTIHHWDNIEEAFAELYSVLRLKGRIVIFTSTPEQMEGYWLNHYFPTMLKDSMEQMPSFDRVKEAMVAASYINVRTETYSVRPDLTDKFLYCGKHDPKMYLDDQIRHGISSFSSLAHKEEVVAGLSTLQEDILSGKVEKVMDDYRNDRGDYLYIIAEKP